MAVSPLSRRAISCALAFRLLNYLWSNAKRSSNLSCSIAAKRVEERWCRFTTQIKPVLQQISFYIYIIKVWTWVAKRATSLVNSFCDTVVIKNNLHDSLTPITEAYVCLALKPIFAWALVLFLGLVRAGGDCAPYKTQMAFTLLLYLF